MRVNHIPYNNDYLIFVFIKSVAKRWKYPRGENPSSKISADGNTAEKKILIDDGSEQKVLFAKDW